jgi:hypothetical protein
VLECLPARDQGVGGGAETEMTRVGPLLADFPL